jgi:hypothetical protein
MPDYEVQVTYIFKGVVTIKDVINPMQAKEYAEKHVGLVIGGNIHSSLPDDQVDWNFAVHPEKKIGKSRRLYKQKKIK